MDFAQVEPREVGDEILAKFWLKRRTWQQSACYWRVENKCSVEAEFWIYRCRSGEKGRFQLKRDKQFWVQYIHVPHKTSLNKYSLYVSASQHEQNLLFCILKPHSRLSFNMGISKRERSMR